MSKEFLETAGTWVLLAPVKNVVLTKRSGWTYRIDRTQLVASRSLPHRWRQLGLPARVSELKKGGGWFLERFFEGVHTFITARKAGVGTDVEPELVKLAEEELAILAMSQLGFAKRHSVGVPYLSHDGVVESRSYLLVNSENVSWTQPNKTVNSVDTLSLNARWRTFAKDAFFEDLLKILRSEIKVSRSWRQDLRNASILVGQSQCTTDLPMAFLRNMIALELLVTKQEESVSEALPSRGEAFLGWVAQWTSSAYPQRIKDAYQKRCLLVHQGKRDAITIEDVYFTDDLILNLLNNICGHIHLFPNKDAVIEFSKKVEAERLLELDGAVRPKTLSFIQRHYSSRDLEG